MSAEERATIKRDLEGVECPVEDIERHRLYVELKNRYRKWADTAEWDWISSTIAEHLGI